MGPLDVLSLRLVLYVVALAICDGLQHPHQGLDGSSCTSSSRILFKSDFREKFANTYF